MMLGKNAVSPSLLTPCPGSTFVIPRFFSPLSAFFVLDFADCGVQIRSLHDRSKARRLSAVEFHKLGWKLDITTRNSRTLVA